jgi:hypothetical protein
MTRALRQEHHPEFLNAVGGLPSSWDPVGVPYGGQDPENQPRSFATVWCLACGNWEDLRLRGDVFLCRDQWRCQERVRKESKVEAHAARRRRRTAA